MASFQALEKLHRLHDGYRNVVRVGHRELILMQEDGRVHILENRCAHMDAPLNFGTVSDGAIRCPLHGIEFDLQSGAAKGSACLKAVRVYQPIYNGTLIGVDPTQV